MIRAILEDRIGRIGHNVVRIVNASWSGNKRSGIKAGNMDVYRQYDDGREEVRNLAVSSMVGYFLYDSYGHMERDEFEIFAVAMSVAVILGGIIGLKIHFRNQSDYEDIIEQIEEITE